MLKSFSSQFAFVTTVKTPWEAKKLQFRDHIFLSQVAIFFYIFAARASFIVKSRIVNTHRVMLLFLKAKKKKVKTIEADY